jgi:hypothetical protein
MSTYLFSNLAKSTLAAAITSGATSLTVAPGSGTLFPNPSGSQYFACILTDAATQTLTEIILVTVRSTDTFTITRAQEGTTALAWSLGDIISHRITAGQMNALAQTANLPGFNQTSIIYFGATDTGSADNIVTTTSPTIASYADGMVFEVTPAATNLTAAPQANICSLGSKSFANAIPGSIVAGVKVLFAYDSASGKMILLSPPANLNSTTQSSGYTSITYNQFITQNASGTVTTNLLTPVSVSKNYIYFNNSAVNQTLNTPAGVFKNTDLTGNGTNSLTVPAGALLFLSSDISNWIVTNEYLVASTTNRGYARQATLTEATNKATSGSVPAFVTPEGLAQVGPWSGTAGSGILPIGAMLFTAGSLTINSTGTVSYIGSYSFNTTLGGGGGNDWRMPSTGFGSITGTWTVVASSVNGSGFGFSFILRTS